MVREEAKDSPENEKITPIHAMASNRHTVFRVTLIFPSASAEMLPRLLTV